MSKISEYLKQILSARYGKDVRQAIHDSIYEINEIANGAQDSATSAANNAIKKASEALASSQNADQKAQEALESAELAKMHAENASAVTGVNIATEDTAGLMKGGENTVDEDGTLVMLRKVSGNNMVLNDSYKGALRINKVFGKSTQDGVPTPDAPVEIVSVGDGGSVETEVLGKNLLKNTATSQTVNGVTFTINKDGTVTASGTATDVVDLKVGDFNAIGGVSYILSGCPSGGHGSRYYMYGQNLATDYGDGKTFTKDATNEQYVIIHIASGYTANNLVFKPMIRLADCQDDTYQPHKPKQSLPINTPNGLPGIPVTDASLANYTDENGQMWCCDERDWARGVDVKRVEVEVFDGSWDEEWYIATGTSIEHIYVLEDRGWIASDSSHAGVNSMNTNFILGGRASTRNTPNVYTLPDGCIHVSLNGTETLDEFKTYLADKPMTLVAILAAPIETPIPEEEMAAWRAMQANEPTTTIFSDADVEVEYPTSRVGAVALDADMRSRENEKDIEEFESSILDTLAEVEANEEEKKIVGALALKELSIGLGGVMGTANISAIGDGTVNGAILFDSLRNLQAANYNGLLSDALIINPTDSVSDLHKPYFVDANAGTTNLPSDCAWGVREVYFVNNNMVTVKITGISKDGVTPNTWMNVYNMTEWKGWDSFLPLTGGTLSGKLNINDGSYGIVEFVDGISRVYGNNAYVEMEIKKALNDFNNRRRLMLGIGDDSKSSLLLTFTNDGVEKPCKIFGEHNKPSGSYTGNGSAERRTINIGGIGNFIVTNNGQGVAIIGQNGGIFSLNGNIAGRYNSSEVTFKNGVLAIATDHATINKSGTTIDYQVL